MPDVLIVEDDRPTLAALEALLSTRGISVAAANNADDAIALGKRDPPKLLVVDWHLDDNHDGMDVAETLGCGGDGPPGILMTGYPIAPDNKRLRALDLHLVSKPLRPLAFAALIGELLESR